MRPSSWPTNRSPGPGRACRRGWTMTSRASASFAIWPSPLTPGTAWIAPTASSTAACDSPRHSSGRRRPTRTSPRPSGRSSTPVVNANAPRPPRRRCGCVSRHATTDGCECCSPGSRVLLVAAIVAGLLAFRQADRADRATVAADARRVGAQALLADDFDQSLLLAVEGVRLDDSIRQPVRPPGRDGERPRSDRGDSN